jgi:hypothetical protein
VVSFPSPLRRVLRPASLDAGRFLFAAALWSLLLSPAAATPPRLSAELAFAVDHLAYEETEGGRVLDREAGAVPSLAVALAAEGFAWHARLRAVVAGADVAYSGRTRSANPALDALPVSTASGARLAGLDVQAGVFGDPGRRLALYAGAAWWTWNRAIAGTSVTSRTGEVVPVSGLDERYAWLELQGGVRVVVLRTGPVDWLADVRVLQVVGGQVSVDVGGERVTLHLGSRPGARLAAAVRWAASPRWSVRAEGSWTTYGFGASEVDGATLLSEPESRTSRAGVEAGVALAF